VYLTQKHAQKIADKLSATITPGRRHEKVRIEYKGQYLGSYGIRRGGREENHDYIPRQIGVTMRQALDLANCPMSKEEYWQLMEGETEAPAS
jgi:hypothetical protein